jgi:hypothetical protein
MTSENINSGSYNLLAKYDSYPYECVKTLMDNEMIWKLLKYNTSDAWNQTDLTKEEKASLIYDGSDNTIAFRVFMEQGQPDVNTLENCQIRVSNSSVFPENRTVATVSIMLEVYSHYKTNHLSNYKTRNDMIMQRMIGTLNGANINGLGRLYFDRLGSESNRLENGGQLPYKGRWAVLSVKAG